MSAASGIIGGTLALSFLELIVANQGAADRVGGLFTTVTAVLNHWLDPAVPLLPDLSTPTTNTTHIEANAYQVPTPTSKYTPAAPQPALTTT